MGDGTPSLPIQRMQVRTKWLICKMLFPLPWSQLRDTCGGMLADALQDVDQVGVDVNAVEPTSHDEALHDTNMFGAQLGPTKIPIFSFMHVRP